jgi:hypothetical protein
MADAQNPKGSGVQTLPRDFSRVPYYSESGRTIQLPGANAGMPGMPEYPNTGVRGEPGRANGLPGFVKPGYRLNGLYLIRCG